MLGVPMPARHVQAMWCRLFVVCWLLVVCLPACCVATHCLMPAVLLGRPNYLQEAVAILSNTSAPQQQLSNALEALRYLVEPVDNANSE